jgi:predicted metal-binding membrane protein
MRNDREMTASDAPPVAVVTVPRRDRIVIASCIALVSVLAWAYLVHRASEMASAQPWPMSGMAMAMMSAPWLPADFAFTFLMWAVMMIGMMAPTALPVLLVFAAPHRQRVGRGVPSIVLVFALGYLTIWLGFSLLATLAQWALSRGALLSPGMTVVPQLGGALLVMAGAYQLSPVKGACLEHCRAPMSFLMSHWRDGRGGAFEMGLRHGLYCLGCCWALMILLFAGGVMNLVVIVTLTVWVLFEKFAPFGEQTASASGIGLLALAVWMLVR